jgi:lipoyl(octanoyl) transferase
LLLNDEQLAAHGARFFRIDRGGDITFHGPGQLVGYPILDLDRFFRDVHRYLRQLEEAIIAVCAAYAITGRRIEGRTGVWVGPDERGTERKICAFGIRCSRWVTLHGFALNVNTDLSYFGHIIPCGISDRGVTSLAAEVGRPVNEEQVKRRLLKHIAEGFGVRITELPADAADAFLSEFLETDWEVPRSAVTRGDHG